MRLDTVIQGGVVVTPGGRLRADVGIRGEKIAAIGTNLTRDATVGRVIDARDQPRRQERFINVFQLEMTKWL